MGGSAVRPRRYRWITACRIRASPGNCGWGLRPTASHADRCGLRPGPPVYQLEDINDPTRGEGGHEQAGREGDMERRYARLSRATTPRVALSLCETSKSTRCRSLA